MKLNASSLKNKNKMKPFLKYVAEDLRSRFGSDLSRVAVVFPNKRAGLFLNEYLLELSDDTPIWAPQYKTISELFGSFSALKTADAIETVCRMYAIYVELTQSTDTLDFFYGWGEKLLADFDDVDKNMADTARLFRNLSEIKTLENQEILTEEQEKVLQEFFRDFSLENQSAIRQKFLELWNNLLPLYQRLNAELAAEGLAYEGALHRSVTEAFEQGKITYKNDIDQYVFVGFNVLNKAEEKLFVCLRKAGKAIFYWDYDTFYAAPGTTFEAGVFLRANLEKFPNALPETYFDNLRHGKHFEFVAAPTENAQAKSVAPWLRQHLTDDEKQTAIVLCNETLLQPVLHSLPGKEEGKAGKYVESVNVTKGFPLSHTPAFTLLESRSSKLLAEQRNIAPLDYLDRLAEAVKEAAVALRERSDEPKAESLRERHTPGGIGKELYAEAYFQTYTILNRFRLLVAGGRLSVEASTLQRLLWQVVRQTSVPFHGEPVVGLQVMGVLETRCLDFRNILMLSVNEGNLPKKASDSSFIPYSLRREFGLTTSLHKTAVFAYYFYRLIQRAEYVRMVYNNSSDGMVKGEMSRFMTQLLVETRIPAAHFTIGGEQECPAAAIKSIAKPKNLPEILSEISPSAINTYLRCQLQFYFQRVARLHEPDPPADVIEPNTFGTLFHATAEEIYPAGIITADTLQRYLDEGGDALLMAAVRRTFEKEGVAPNIVIMEVLVAYLRQLIRHDLPHAPFEVIETEKEASTNLAIPCGEGIVTMRLKGSIDRLDLMNIDGVTTCRVVDYKTGGKPESPKDLEQLFTPAEQHPHYVLQTFLYSLMLTDGASEGEKYAKFPIAPALFFVHRSAAEDYSPYIEIGLPSAPDEAAKKSRVLHFQKEIAADFRPRLVRLLAEILNPETDFVPTETAAFCKTCPFSELCRR